MKFSFPEGVKVDLSAFLVRCALCRRTFAKGETITTGANLELWAHVECWEDYDEKTKLSIANLQLGLFDESGLGTGSYATSSNSGDQGGEFANAKAGGSSNVGGGFALRAAERYLRERDESRLINISGT